LIGLKGYETLQLPGNTEDAGNLPFIIQNSPAPYSGQLGFFSTSPYDTFWTILNENLPSETFTVAFDKFPTNGAITLGSQDTKRCYKDWRIVPETIFVDSKGDNRFGANITK
jgi:hypothetical protein